MGAKSGFGYTACGEVAVVGAAQLGRVGVAGWPVHWLLWDGSCVCRVAAESHE